MASSCRRKRANSPQTQIFSEALEIDVAWQSSKRATPSKRDDGAFDEVGRQHQLMRKRIPFATGAHVGQRRELPADIRDHALEQCENLLIFPKAGETWAVEDPPLVLKDIGLANLWRKILDFYKPAVHPHRQHPGFLCGPALAADLCRFFDSGPIPYGRVTHTRPLCNLMDSELGVFLTQPGHGARFCGLAWFVVLLTLRAVKIGRSGHPVQNDGGRGWTALTIGSASAWRPRSRAS